MPAAGRLENGMRMRPAPSTALVLAVIAWLGGAGSTTLGAGRSSQAVKPDEYKALAKPGEKVPLGPDRYVVYGFASRPKLGTAIMRVEIFASDGRRDTTFVVKGDVDMPSMRGAHSTGARPFSLSAKGVYLLPVPLVMPGEWEFRFTFEKSGKTLLRGAYLFTL
jgi:hypothetical protein